MGCTALNAASKIKHKIIALKMWEILSQYTVYTKSVIDWEWKVRFWYLVEMKLL